MFAAERDGGSERGAAGPGGGGAGAAPPENTAGRHSAQDGECARLGPLIKTHIRIFLNLSSIVLHSRTTFNGGYRPNNPVLTQEQEQQQE